MIHYLAFDTPCPANTLPRVGGGASLPADIPWPDDSHGVPMLHLMSLPAGFVNAHAAVRLPDGHAVSVFVPYRKDAIDHVFALARDPKAARVIVHPVAEAVRNEGPWPLDPPHGIRVDSERDADDEDEFADEIEGRIGGQATWLQDRIEVPGSVFLLQATYDMFEDCWPSHRGLFLGGVIYLFMDAALDGPALDGGQVTLQYT